MAFVSNEALPPPPWSSERASPPRRQLSREVIVDAAMEIVDEEGLDGLSMRRLIARHLRRNADRLG